MTPDAPYNDPEYRLDGTNGTIRFEEPATGVTGNVAKTSVTDVAPGTCAVPSF